jgi:uncharacterized membrane protein YciS (DUF1049 family)
VRKIYKGVNGASSTTSFWNRWYFQSITFLFVLICFFEIKNENWKIFCFCFFVVQGENQHMTFCLCTVIQLPNMIHYQLLKVFYFNFQFKIPKINIKKKKKKEEGFVLCGFYLQRFFILFFILLVGCLEFRCECFIQKICDEISNIYLRTLLPISQLCVHVTGFESWIWAISVSGGSLQ